MGLKLYLFSIYVSILVSLSLAILLWFNINPYVAPSWIIATFYFTIFILITSIFTIIGYYYKVWASNREVIFNHLFPTLRQASILSLIFVGLLLLEQIKALNWWIACLFIVSILMLELFFRSRK